MNILDGFEEWIGIKNIFVTKWRSCSLLSRRRLLGKSKARMHSTDWHFKHILCWWGFYWKPQSWRPFWLYELSVTQLSEEGGRRTIDNHSSQFFQSHHILRASSKLLLGLACPHLDHLGNRLIRATSLVWLHRLPPGQETPYQAGLGLMGNILGLIFLGF